MRCHGKMKANTGKQWAPGRSSRLKGRGGDASLGLLAEGDDEGGWPGGAIIGSIPYWVMLNVDTLSLKRENPAVLKRGRGITLSPLFRLEV